MPERRKTKQTQTPSTPADAAPADLGHDLKITKRTRRAGGAGTWVTGTVHGHQFQALVFPEHAEVAEYEIGDSRISKLALRRLADRREVYFWDRGPDVPAADATANAIVNFLAARLAPDTYGGAGGPKDKDEQLARPPSGASVVYGAQRPGGPASPDTAEGEQVTMKKDEIEVGGTYLAKVGARSVEVRIAGENAKGGWNATSVASGKPVRIKDPQHLRPAKSAGDGTAPSGEEPTRVVTDAEGAPADGDLVPLTQLDKQRKSGKRKAKAPAEKAAKAPREKKPPKEKKAKAMSALDAAAAVLKAKGEPMQCKAIVEGMKEKGLWSTNAPTPAATLYSAILREITTKGRESRFKKTDRGHFALNA